MDDTELLPAEIMPGTQVPRRFAFPIGMFVIYFSALDAELNQLIRHVAGMSGLGGQAMIAAVPGFEARARQLEELAVAKIPQEQDRDKVIRLAREYLRIADYQHALLHHDFFAHFPLADSPEAHFARSDTTPRPVELSDAWLIYHTNLAAGLSERMHQYRTGDPLWTDDTNFPWYDEPMIDPDTVPHLMRRPKQH